MDRSEYLSQYHENTKEAMEMFLLKFARRISDRPELLKDLVYDALEQAAGKMQSQGKPEGIYHYFSLLQIDLLAHKFSVALQVFDDSWYLDQNPVTLQVSLDHLLEDLAEYEEELKKQARTPEQMIHQYDIQSSLLDLVKPINGLITCQLRYALRDMGLLKGDYWQLCWGEYCGDNMVVVQRDRQKKSSREWQRSVRKTAQDKHCLSTSYWWQLELACFDCSNMHLDFICFDHCNLNEISFEKADLTGASFRHTVLRNCSFKGCKLEYVDFSETIFEGTTSFDNAVMTGAVFQLAEARKLEFSAIQQEVVLVIEGTKGDEA